MQDVKIGFVGLGQMGGTMAARLLASYPVYGNSRTRERALGLIDAGLHWCQTPRAVAEAADVVFTSLPDDRAVESVYAGEHGLIAGLAEGKTCIDLSTVSPDSSRLIAARVRIAGAAMLAAPVSGSVPQADEGTLTIIVGGSETAYARVAAILRELGTPVHVGDHGHAQSLKLGINISVAVQILALAEGLMLAEHAGMGRSRALEVMTSSAIASPVLKSHASMVLDPPAPGWFAVALMAKDMRLALDAAAQQQIELPTASRAAAVLGVARKLGYEHHDIAALYQVLERMNERHASAA